LIEIEKARSGHAVIRKNGRLLGSSIDPLKEAKAWAEKASPQLEPSVAGFVLGAGSGYHVAALAVLSPSSPLIVVEPDHEVLREAARLGEWPSHVQAVCAITDVGGQGSDVAAEHWLAHPAVRDGLGGRFAILKHGPSCVMEPASFNAVEALLLAREKVAWLKQLKLRPGLCALLDPDAIKNLGAAPVSIKTLQSLFKSETECTRERRIWKILEELVL
jgi:hypothetical protein